MARPLTYSSVDELQEAIDAYFRECDPHIADEPYLEYPKKKVKRGRQEWEEDDLDREPIEGVRRVITKQLPYTVAGLAYALGIDRSTLMRYEAGDFGDPDDEDYDELAAEFCHTIKKAKARIAQQKEQRLLMGQVHPAAGIFDLKVNHGYVDTVVIDDTGEKKFIIETRQAGSSERAALPAVVETMHDKKSRAARASNIAQGRAVAAIEGELVDDDDEPFDDPQPANSNPVEVIRTITAEA